MASSYEFVLEDKIDPFTMLIDFISIHICGLIFRYVVTVISFSSLIFPSSPALLSSPLHLGFVCSLDFMCMCVCSSDFVRVFIRFHVCVCVFIRFCVCVCSSDFVCVCVNLILWACINLISFVYVCVYLIKFCLHVHQIRFCLWDDFLVEMK